MYVAVAGNIGAGKSTLTRLLSERFHLSPVYEAVDENPYLEDFYGEMRRYAFHSQVFFLARRLEQHLGQVNPGNRVIQDRTIYEDAAIFARALAEEGVLSARDHAVYRRLYEALERTLRAPDLLLYLRSSVPTLQRRIRQRGRSFEQGISASYLGRLNALYESWIGAYERSRVLVVPTDAHDLHDPAERERLFALLAAHGLSEPVLS